MATLILTDGTESKVSPKNGKTFELDELYTLIGNGCDMVQMIELVGGEKTMWMDEESKLKPVPPPVNSKATVLLAEAGGIYGDEVLGNVLIMEPGEMD